MSNLNYEINTAAAAKASFLDEMKETMEAFSNDLWDQLMDRGETSCTRLHREDGAIDNKLAKAFVAFAGREVINKWEDEIMEDVISAVPTSANCRCGIRGPPPHSSARCTVPSHEMENYQFHEEVESKKLIRELYEHGEY